MDEHKKTLKKLKKFGIEDVDIEQSIPTELSGGWRLHQEKNSKGNTLVEYKNDQGDMFPVAFVTEDPKHAKGMMLLWLKENKRT